MQIGNQTTFTQIQQQFQPGKFTPGALANKHLRFDGGNQLYTHSSSPFKISGFGAQAAQARATKHADGAAQVKAAIDREFGAGTANRVFASIQQQTGRNLDQGVKRSDLAAIQQAIRADQSPASLALGDPDLPHVSRPGQSPVDPQQLMGFFGRNFEAVSSPEFWQHQSAKMNVENFGCGLALTQLDRVVQSGQLTEQDRQTFNRLMSPDGRHGVNPPQLPPTAVGPLTPQTKQQMIDNIHAMYGQRNADYLLNMEGWPHEAQLQQVFNAPTSTADDKIAAMKHAYDQTIAGQYFNTAIGDILQTMT
jgi:hypothetical protein